MINVYSHVLAQAMFAADEFSFSLVMMFLIIGLAVGVFSIYSPFALPRLQVLRL